MGFFKFLELKYDQLSDQINTYLKQTYNRGNESFTSASPFGQVVNVQKELFQFNTLYQKNIF